MKKTRNESRWAGRNVAGIVALAFWLGGCGAREEPPPSTPATKPAGLASAPAELSGKTTLQGTPPAPRSVKFDAMCGKLHTQPVAERGYRVGAGNGLADVFVYVKTGLEGQSFSPRGEPLLDQEGCIYEPYVLGVMTDQKIKIRNSDPLLHNVHAVPTRNKGFNFAQPVKGQVNEKSFSEPEVFVRIKCDVHPWMETYVGVVPHPFFAVSDKDGRYELPAGLPPGRYTIEAVHPKAGAVSKDVTLAAGERQKLDFTFEFSRP